jgi:hypothetical protein
LLFAVLCNTVLANSLGDDRTAAGQTFFLNMSGETKRLHHGNCYDAADGIGGNVSFIGAKVKLRWRCEGAQ